jgi:hypothetical protein
VCELYTDPGRHVCRGCEVAKQACSIYASDNNVSIDRLDALVELAAANRELDAADADELRAKLIFQLEFSGELDAQEPPAYLYNDEELLDLE